MGLWRIVINQSTPHKSTCTCPNFFKEYICKHVLGILIRQKFLIYPHQAKDEDVTETVENDVETILQLIQSKP